MRKECMDLKKRITALTLTALAFGTLLTSCGRFDGSYYAENRTYADYDVARKMWLDLEVNALDLAEPDPSAQSGEDSSVYPNDTTVDPDTFRMRVVDGMNLYEAVDAVAVKERIPDNTVVQLTLIENSEWALVRDVNGKMLGYAKDGFAHTIDSDCHAYAQLPIEYGQARTNDGTYVDAYSHLVDIRQYFNCYVSTDPSNEGVDITQYDLKISMKLSTNETSINQPFYSRNLCMVQYDLIPKLQKAIERFRADGYTIVIYDAYRPTGVQRRWFDVVRVHKWVANPDIGMGGVHDRGTALDISLIDKNGNELEMPTPMHTFSEASSRNSKTMTETARKNMNYMLSVMQASGFTYINSEWWHFQDVNTKYYLPTDHAIDSIPLVVTED